jgi:hypothetical protein
MKELERKHKQRVKAAKKAAEEGRRRQEKFLRELARSRQGPAGFARRGGLSRSTSFRKRSGFTGGSSKGGRRRSNL